MREHYIGKLYSSSRQHTVTVCAGMATHEADEGIAPAMKRVRVRQDCPHCGISLGKSSFYEHIVICTHKDDSDSAFEIPSDEDPVNADHLLPEPTEGESINFRWKRSRQ